MSSKRDKIDIINDMLEAIRNSRGKIKPTHLLYKSNMAHTKMKIYIEELKDKGMVDELMEKKRKYFTITEKGLNFIEDYRRMKEFANVFGF